MGDVAVQIKSVKGDLKATGEIKLQQGGVERRVPLLKSSKDSIYKWPAGGVKPWADHVAGIDGGIEVECFSMDRMRGLRAVVDKRRYVLLMAEAV